MLTKEDVLIQSNKIKEETKSNRFNLNFFCFETEKEKDEQKIENWKKLLQLKEQGLEDQIKPSSRFTFNESYLPYLFEINPLMVSFHFGLPATSSLEQIKQKGILIAMSATTHEEVDFLSQNNLIDLIILQGIKFFFTTYQMKKKKFTQKKQGTEAGGHSGKFIGDILDYPAKKTSFELLNYAKKQKNISKEVVVAGGIKNSADVESALSNGASFVQIGTPFLISKQGFFFTFYFLKIFTNFLI